MNKKYKIEIWQYHSIVDTFESDNINEILEWYKEKWQPAYRYGACAFYVYKNNKRLDFNEEDKLGFFDYDYED